jgi:outer membrane beta-barrel protein
MGSGTDLAKLGRKGLRSSTLPRVSVALSLAGALWLAMGTSAEAAPSVGGSTDNPFDKDTANQDKTGGTDGDATDDQPTPPPPAAADDAKGSASDDGAESGDEPESEGQGEDEPQSALHALTCLEGDGTGGGRRKGVQRRDFLKRHRFELSGVGGFYASDTLSSTYSYGGALAFYPSEDFGIEVLVTRSPVKFRLEEPFNSFDQERHFVPGIAWQGIASLLWSPIHAKLKFTDETIIHADIFAVLGTGRTFHESVLGLTWEAGLGLKLYLAHYVTLRFDVRDFLLPQEVLGRGRLTNNITVLGGLSLWLPG